MKRRLPAVLALGIVIAGIASSDTSRGEQPDRVQGDVQHETNSPTFDHETDWAITPHHHALLEGARPRPDTRHTA